MYGAHSTGSAPTVGQDEIKPNAQVRPDIVWDEKLSGRLADLWKDHSAGKIVKILQAEGHRLTRSAVMGRIHRMKLHGKGRRGRGRPPKPKNLDRNSHNADVQVQAINRRPRVAPESAPSAAKPPRGTTTFTDLRMFSDVVSNQCRFIEGDADAVVYCGTLTAAGQPYCAHHHKVAHGRQITITEADRARRRTHATKVWFGASAKLIGNPAEAS